ncbi:phosphatidylinositol glycan anchor biosynthesis class U protein [Aethina tumida]|uniref:phosphatidylinositol glycan anchor biosynthesis class U protein n=1 Tax=Aethina tumida TaxID=116153 RepID=UPI00096AF7E3|nr:phosphatidylinositol glycan anchor biosynthesis class U protein [Aethina tumida]
MSANNKNGSLRIFAATVLAAGVRFWLMHSKYQKIIANHIEVSTPLNSWKRVSEGLFLISKHISPYNGDLLHESPLLLYMYKQLLKIFWNNTGLMFITLDMLTGFVLYITTKKYLNTLYKKEERQKLSYAPDTTEYLLTFVDSVKAPNLVLLTFLFNPFTILNCIGCSTAVIFYLFLSMFLCAMVHGKVTLSSVFLSICTSMSFYPITLIIPLCLYFVNTFSSKLKAVSSVGLFLASLFSIHTFCYKYDPKYFMNVYGFILSVPDLQPNIGLFWYFFTEMFDHFRELFIYSFQINATILYLIPLAIKFRQQPFLLTYALLFLITVFKSYPCIGDVGFVISLLPSFMYLFRFCQQGFPASVVYIITTTLAPILWHLWIYCNSANANFYFGVTLAFAIAQIFLLTDVLFAQVKREYYLKNGKNISINGQDGNLTLE